MKNFALDFVIDENGTRLSEQFVHCFFASAGNGLIGTDDNALDGSEIMQGLKRDQHLNGGTIRVRDDVALGVARNRFGVDFGHDQRNIGIHTEMRGVVDHDAARLARARGKFFGNFGTGGRQADIHALKVEFCEILNR